MKNMKKIVCSALVAMVMLATSLPALAGSIITPNGGRATLWKSATSSGSDYVAYISSGNSATLLSTKSSSNRYNVKAYGYNSKNVSGIYKGWINTAYYKPD